MIFFLFLFKYCKVLNDKGLQAICCQAVTQVFRNTVIPILSQWKSLSFRLNLHMLHSLLDHEFLLLPEKAMLWKETNTLLVSDLHMGKGGHFRKNGVALPVEVNMQNLWTLSGLLMDHKPDRLLLLGDLFHSRINKEWDQFVDMLDQFPAIEKVLVRGNHDVIPEYHFEDANIKLVEELREGPFIFSHEPLEEWEGYNLCGHIHPAVVLRGGGRQRLRVPCFYFGENQGIMPSFGYFTGSHTIKPKKSDKVYVSADGSVLRIS